MIGHTFRIGEVDVQIPEGHPLPEFQAQYPLYDRFLPTLGPTLGHGLIVDVGANFGGTAIAMAQTCDNPILAIEVLEDYGEFLCKNAKLFPPGRIRPLIARIGTRYTRLDDILAGETIALLKVDTDGSDGDVLMSAMNTITAQRPPLFWENEPWSDPEPYENSYRALEALGYRLSIFDNFGCLMFSDVGFDTLRQLNRYVAQQQTRTIYYVDTLAKIP